MSDIKELKRISEIVLDEFGNLDNVQLNWKESEMVWSIAQVLEHLTVSNRKYFEGLNRVLGDNYRPSFWEKINPFTGYTGKRMIYNLGEVIHKKYITPMQFRPPSGMITDALSRFHAMQEELISIFSKVDDKSKGDRVITSPVANLVSIKINDVLMLLVAHERRHIQQAVKVKNCADFPK